MLWNLHCGTMGHLALTEGATESQGAQRPSCHGPALVARQMRRIIASRVQSGRQRFLDAVDQMSAFVGLA